MTGDLQMPHFDHLLPLLAAAAVTACADARTERMSGAMFNSAQWAEEAAPQDGCSVTIVFGSFATGPDPHALHVIGRLLRADPAVTKVTRSPYGREGEHSLCIRTPNRRSATRLFDTLESAIRGPVVAPVTIVGPERAVVVPTGVGARRHP